MLDLQKERTALLFLKKNISLSAKGPWLGVKEVWIALREIIVYYWGGSRVEREREGGVSMPTVEEWKSGRVLDLPLCLHYLVQNLHSCIVCFGPRYLQ